MRLSIPTILHAVALPLLSLLPAVTAQACNNSPELCARHYHNITYLGAHDSPFLRTASNDYTTSGNQFFNTTVQLDAGVRLLTAQVHAYETDEGTTEWHLCHSSCALLDAGTLSSWLAEIKQWLDANPSDVVTVVLVNSDDLTAADFASEYEISGITTYVFSPTAAEDVGVEDANGTAKSATLQWPNLSDMIAANTRLVTFVASLANNTGAPYLLNEFDHVFENAYDVTSAANLSCLPDRPASLAGSPEAALVSGRLFLMNHFLDELQAFGIETPDVANVATTNSPDPTISSSIAARLAACAATYAKKPNFVLVDFFNVGPAIQAVDAVNGVAETVTGRLNVTTEIVGGIHVTAASSGAAAAAAGGLRVGGGWGVGAAVALAAVVGGGLI